MSLALIKPSHLLEELSLQEMAAPGEAHENQTVFTSLKVTSKLNFNYSMRVLWCSYFSLTQFLLPIYTRVIRLYNVFA